VCRTASEINYYVSCVEAWSECLSCTIHVHSRVRVRGYPYIDRIDLLSPGWIQIKSRWPDNFHTVKSIYAGMSGIRMSISRNDSKSNRRCLVYAMLAYSELFVVSPANTRIRSHRGLHNGRHNPQVPSQSRGIPDARRNLDGDGGALGNGTRTIIHRRSRNAVIDSPREYPRNGAGRGRSFDTGFADLHGIKKAKNRSVAM